MAMTVGGDPETWHHVAGVTDAETQEEILYLDGEEVARKAGATLQDRGNPMRISIGLPSAATWAAPPMSFCMLIAMVPSSVALKFPE